MVQDPAGPPDYEIAKDADYHGPDVEAHTRSRSTTPTRAS